MPTCDICGRDITQGEMNVVDAKLIVDATEQGFVPKKLPLEEFDAAFGIRFDKSLMWRGTVRDNSGAQWGLCAKCLRNVQCFDRKKWWQLWK